MTCYSNKSGNTFNILECEPTSGHDSVVSLFAYVCYMSHNKEIGLK